MMLDSSRRNRRAKLRTDASTFFLSLSQVFLKRFGITVKFVEADNPDDFEKLIDDKTKAIYLESISNSK